MERVSLAAAVAVRKIVAIVVVGVAGRNRVGASTPSRRDPFLQFDDLEATLPLGLASWRDLDLAAGLRGLLELARFHGEPPSKHGNRKELSNTCLFSVAKDHPSVSRE
jgi:hypothetical protein